LGGCLFLAAQEQEQQRRHQQWQSSGGSSGICAELTECGAVKVNVVGGAICDWVQVGDVSGLAEIGQENFHLWR
jgi:hypothetical protein